MNVLFLTSTLPRFAGDQQAGFVLEQARAWARARPRDRVHILAPHDVAAALSETIDGVIVARFRYMWPARLQSLAYPAIMPNLRRNPFRLLQVPLLLWCQYRAAKRIIRRSDIDLVYAHWVMPQGIVAAQLKRFTGVPYILQNHSSDLAVFRKFGALGRALARGILRHAARFFCVNSDQARAARDLLPDLDCHVLPMGVALQGTPRAPQRRSGAPRYGLGTIGRLSRKKGIDHLIAAAEKLAMRGQRPKIAIAGDGEDSARLRELPRAADVTFAGFVSGVDKAAFFDDCQVLAFPSVASKGDVEGLPVAILEAMAAGKPIIASKDTNIMLLEEWPQIAQAFILLDDPSDLDAFADAITQSLALDSEHRAALAKLLQRVAARYDWDRLIMEYLAIIDGDPRDIL